MDERIQESLECVLEFQTPPQKKKKTHPQLQTQQL